MAELYEYSEKQQKIMYDAVKNDNGFHSSFSISEIPLAEMLSVDDRGLEFTQKSATVSINSEVITYRLDIRFSDEQNCWFFTITDGTSSFSGIIHFNTIYNARGEFAVIFLNDSELDDSNSITMALPYSNIFVMRK